MTEWFEEWFGEEYLLLYPHRDAGEADRMVDLILARIPLPAGARVLDIACGAGRHARAFARRGLTTIGVDLSWPLLLRARETARIPLIRADLRHLPVRRGGVDLAVNLFTSFGYFTRDDEHESALREMIGTLRPGGWFVFDFFNARWVTDHLVRHEDTVLAGVPVQVDRWISDDGCFVHKTITTSDRRQFMERVRLLDADGLTAMFRTAGLTTRAILGTYQGDPYTEESPRFIFMGQSL